MRDGGALAFDTAVGSLRTELDEVAVDREKEAIELRFCSLDCGAGAGSGGVSSFGRERAI